MPLRAFIATLLTFAFSSCDSPPPEQSVTATLHLHRPPFAGENFLIHQINTLKNSHPDLKIRRIKDSDLITFTAHHSDQEQAREIIQLALDSYSTQRSQQDSKDLKESLHLIDEKILKQQQFIQEKQDFADRHIVPYAIPIVTEVPSERKVKARASQRLDEFKTQSAQLEIELKKLASLKGDDRVNHAAGLHLPDNQVDYYYSLHRETENKRLIALAKGLAKNHPTITALKQESVKFLKEARLEVVSLTENLKTKLELNNRQVERMESIVDDTKRNQPDPLMERMHERLKIYLKANADLKQARETLEDLKSKKDQLKQSKIFPNPPFTIQGWDHHPTS